jgi:hypothetical protein
LGAGHAAGAGALIEARPQEAGDIIQEKHGIAIELLHCIIP